MKIVYQASFFYFSFFNLEFADFLILFDGFIWFFNTTIYINDILSSAFGFFFHFDQMNLACNYCDVEIFVVKFTNEINIIDNYFFGKAGIIFVHLDFMFIDNYRYNDKSLVVYVSFFQCGWNAKFRHYFL